MSSDKNYVVYHCHTMLSNGTTLMDSVTRFEDYVNRAKECGMAALAISEHGSTFEWKKKKDAIEAAGMKYIHAEEFYLTEKIIWRTVNSAKFMPDNYQELRAKSFATTKGDDKKAEESFKKKLDKILSDALQASGYKHKKSDGRIYFDERNLFEADDGWYVTYLDTDLKFKIDPSSIEKVRDEKKRDNYHCILIARNYEGFLELNRLESTSFQNDGHNYYSPRITFDELFSTSDNIIVTSACVGGALCSGTESAKNSFLDFMIKHKDRCFLEIQHHNTDKQREYNMYLYTLSKKYGIPLIAATDTHCLNKTHEKGRYYYQLKRGVHFDDENGWDLTWKTYNEFVEAFDVQCALPEEAYIEAIDNTNVMADMVEPIVLDLSFKYPRISQTAAEDLRKKIYDGANSNKYLLARHTAEEIKNRLDEELETYKAIDACDYMLLEKYIVDWCHSNDIWLGPGRGSVTGALSAYAMGITGMDSLKYDLKFWRFMSKDKYSLADIDLDHANEDREKVKHFLLHDHLNLSNIKTAEIITFNTIQLKGAIRDMGSALGMNPNDVDKIAKAVHEVTVGEEKQSTIDDSYRKKYPKLFELVDIVTGVVKSVGSHPSGVLVADRDIFSELGCCYIKDDEYPVCVLNMKELDSMNWVKWDILGLDNVGIINNTCKLANISRVNPDNIPEDDIDVWNSIRDDTSLIFQWNSNFGSQTMKKLFSDETIAKIKKVYPNISYIDLFSFGNALIRPCGKSQYDSAVNGEITTTGVKDIDGLLSSELNRCLFQEDIMSFVMQFCGYSFIQADKLRKIIGKKLGTKEQIPLIREAFNNNAKVKYNLTDEQSEKIIEPVLQCILDATRYSFSKNHAYAYSWIGYMCGYLRYYYPVEYLTSCLDIFAGNEDKTNEAVSYANKFHITINPPKFGHARADYLPDKEHNAIYKGMKSIKYMNEDVANALYNCSKEKEFTHFVDVLYSAKGIGMKANQIKILIKLDFFDCFGNARVLTRVFNMFTDFFKKGEASSISKDKVAGNEVIKSIIERHSVGVTKTGKPSKTYTQLDCPTVMRECEEYLLSLNIPDFTIKEKIDFHNEYFGYIGIITHRPKDRTRLIVTCVRPLESNGEVWAYGVTAQSLGSGKKSEYTIYANSMREKIQEKDVIYVNRKDFDQNKKGYWIIKKYRIEVGL